MPKSTNERAQRLEQVGRRTCLGVLRRLHGVVRFHLPDQLTLSGHLSARRSTRLDRREPHMITLSCACNCIGQRHSIKTAFIAAERSILAFLPCDAMHPRY